MTKTPAPANTPTVAISRALRAFGLKSGRDFRTTADYNRFKGPDGRWYKERKSTTVHLNNVEANKIVGENAREIEDMITASDWSAYVVELYVSLANGRTFIITNAPGSHAKSITRDARDIDAVRAEIAEIQARPAASTLTLDQLNSEMEGYVTEIQGARLSPQVDEYPSVQDEANGDLRTFYVRRWVVRDARARELDAESNARKHGEVPVNGVPATPDRPADDTRPATPADEVCGYSAAHTMRGVPATTTRDCGPVVGTVAMCDACAKFYDR